MSESLTKDHFNIQSRGRFPYDRHEDSNYWPLGKPKFEICLTHSFHHRPLVSDRLL